MRRFFFCLLIGGSGLIHAQEICNNGIDDDGDGLIDCFDGDCASSSDCPAFTSTTSPCSPTGGSKADILSVQTEYRAPAGAAATFSIPSGATKALVKIVSTDGRTGSADERFLDEDFITASVVVDLVSNESSGFINYAQSTHTSGTGTTLFGWNNAPFGSLVSGSAVSGHDVTPLLNDLTFSVSGTTLTITESNTATNSTYVVEFTSPNTSSLAQVGFASAYLPSGTSTANIPLNANANLIYVRAKGTLTRVSSQMSPGGMEEGYSDAYFIIDVDNNSASGHYTVVNGGTDDARSNYTFSNHDMTTTSSNRVLDATVAGDVTGNTTLASGIVGLANPDIYFSGGNLVIERDAAFTSDYDVVYTVEFFQRIPEPMSSEFIETQSAFIAAGQGTATGTSRTFTIPAGASYALFRQAGNAINSINEPNENALAGYAFLDLRSERATGYFYQQVGFNNTTRRDDNFPFEDLPLDGTSARTNATTGIKSSYSYDINFSLSTDKSQLTVENKAGLVAGNYQYLLSVDFFGARPDYAFNTGNISFSKGSSCSIVTATVELCNPGSGDSPGSIPIAFYDADPTTDPNAVLLHASVFSNPLKVGACTTHDIDIDLSAYNDLNIPITVIINDDGSFVSGGVGSSVGTTFALTDLESQNNGYKECNYANNLVNQTISVNNCPFVDLDENNSSGATNNDYQGRFCTFGTPVRIADIDVKATEPDGATITGATITLTNRPNTTDEALSLAGALPAGISATAYNNTTGILELSGNASLSDYETAIELVQYQNTSTSVDYTARVITVYLNDGVEQGPVATSTLSIVDCSSDNDLVNDDVDVDDDNDGILDVVELCGPSATDFSCLVDVIDNTPGVGGTALDPGADEDGDGIPNYRDAFDNDGGGDFENSCPDVDGNGICDNLPQSIDQDGDGIPNHIDLDADNDGIADIIEAGGIDENGDGRIDGAATDSDGDGLLDPYDTKSGGFAIANTDTDGDGVPNFLDLDSDNDGITDVVEAGGSDTNRDGLTDAFVDNDQDGFNDLVDGDANNDGTAENTANALLVTGPDAPTADGKPSTYLNGDFDADGIPNAYDLDADNDGIPDYIEGVATGGINATGGIPAGVDANGNGVLDSYENLNNNNNSASGTNIGVVPNDDNDDNDNTPDYLDLDSDGDNSLDWEEGFDADNDGQTAGDLQTFATNYETNNGNPGHYPATDPTTDSDSDNLPDWADNAPSAKGYTAASRPPFLTGGNSAFIDNNNNGLADIFDPAMNGTEAPTPNNSGIDDDDWRDPATTRTLPIALLDFKAAAQGAQSKLQWWTATEENSAYFSIERLVNNTQTFETIGQVQAAGQSNNTLKYQFIDATPAVGYNYYRLKLVDIDGTSSYSEVRAVEMKAPEAELVIYPNPTKGQLFLQWSEIIVQPQTEVRIFNALGQEVLHTTLSTPAGRPASIEVNHLPNGVYHIQIQLAHKMQSSSFVIQH